MNMKSRIKLSALVITGMVSALSPSSLRADVGPPVDVKVSWPNLPAVSGQEFDGVFEIHLFEAGEFADVEVF